MHLKNSKIIVIKIGSALLVDSNKKIRNKWFSNFAKDIKKLKSKNKKIIIVSSGAIALGCKKMKFNKSRLKLDKSQAIASIGQIELMNLFTKTFSKYKLNISQILLTLDDTEERRRSINAKRTFENLFQLDYIPIVNENDTIATSEIKYGDNDRLASRVAQITNADTLILLSDVDGLFTKNPKIFKDAKLIKKIDQCGKFVNFLLIWKRDVSKRGNLKPTICHVLKFIITLRFIKDLPKKYCKKFDPNSNKSVIYFENSKISEDTVAKMLPKVKSYHKCKQTGDISKM